VDLSNQRFWVPFINIETAERLKRSAHAHSYTWLHFRLKCTCVCAWLQFHLVNKLFWHFNTNLQSLNLVSQPNEITYGSPIDPFLLHLHI